MASLWRIIVCRFWICHRLVFDASYNYCRLALSFFELLPVHRLFLVFSSSPLSAPLSPLSYSFIIMRHYVACCSLLLDLSEMFHYRDMVHWRMRCGVFHSIRLRIDATKVLVSLPVLLSNIMRIVDIRAWYKFVRRVHRYFSTPPRTGHAYSATHNNRFVCTAKCVYSYYFTRVWRVDVRSLPPGLQRFVD